MKSKLKQAHKLSKFDLIQANKRKAILKEFKKDLELMELEDLPTSIVKNDMRFFYEELLKRAKLLKDISIMLIKEEMRN